MSRTGGLWARTLRSNPTTFGFVGATAVTFRQTDQWCHDLCTLPSPQTGRRTVAGNADGPRRRNSVHVVLARSLPSLADWKGKTSENTREGLIRGDWKGSVRTLTWKAKTTRSAHTISGFNTTGINDVWYKDVPLAQASNLALADEQMHGVR